MGGEQPAEFFELQLCRMYQCTPVELAKVPMATILAHVTCANVEAQINKAKTK